MAANIDKIASLMGAERVVLVPDAGGGAFGAARTLSAIQSMRRTSPVTDSLVADLLHQAVELVRGEFSDQHRSMFERIAIHAESESDIAREQGLSLDDLLAIRGRIYRSVREKLRARSLSGSA